MRQSRIAIVVGLLAITGALCFYRSSSTPSQVEYKSYKGDDATEIAMALCSPESDPESVPETLLSQQFRPQELLVIEASMWNDNDSELVPIIVQISQQRSDNRTVVAASAAAVPDKTTRTVRLFVNAPSNPGTYNVIVGRMDAKSIVARAHLTVSH